MLCSPNVHLQVCSICPALGEKMGLVLLLMGSRGKEALVSVWQSVGACLGTPWGGGGCEWDPCPTPSPGRGSPVFTGNGGMGGTCSEQPEQEAKPQNGTG